MLALGGGRVAMGAAGTDVAIEAAQLALARARSPEAVRIGTGHAGEITSGFSGHHVNAGTVTTRDEIQGPLLRLELPPS